MAFSAHIFEYLSKSSWSSTAGEGLGGLTLFGGSWSHGRDRKVGDSEISKSQAKSSVFLFLLPEELDIEILATSLALGLPACTMILPMTIKY